jgi:hypothetical protein
LIVNILDRLYSYDFVKFINCASKEKRMIPTLKSLEIKDERFLKSFTGLGLNRYEALRPVFEEVVSAYEACKRKPAKSRKRKPGAGRPSKLPGTDDKLVFVLHYFKAYPTMDNLGSTLGMSRGSACGLVHHYAGLLKQSLEILEVMPKRQFSRPDELLELLKELGDIDQLLIDVTERPHRRLRDKEKRDALYSGKKSALP